ncbi:class I SAM-dependent DNA methyltransferase [Polluticoccus soli]|uniref:class I SAM-dependent DNA methyltransferase n=1 Tax=Polluticoccus soli TaxID=3034150 RepID=UPI0023E2F7E7|nr:DNA methyltransferase [Flavipsychrobacter sp. JY13-12]
MPLSLNEIRTRAFNFINEWKDETNEDAEAKSFWDQFFQIFGISRRRIATFEEAVAREGRGKGFIDLLWKGTLLIEHKSRGKDLERAFTQAKDYFPGLKDHELPRYIIVCDFYNFRIYDLDEGTDKSFTLDKLVDNLDLFDFLSGYKRHIFKDQAPINIKAAEQMGKLHDALKEIGYSGHQLELYLVRLLFCLFADDTNIFEKGVFYELLDSRTAEDGSDLAQWIAQLFEVLNTPQENRLKNLDESLAAFPYVNGKLFEEQLRMAAFDSKMRKILLDCCALDWSSISPAIFGSLFQSVMDEKARRNLGAHYTSEKNILKLIKPLFLDELYEEFNKVKTNARQLDAFHTKLSTLRFLDPACGCGNFLIIAYRELRLLEIEVIKAKFKNQMATNIDAYINVNVDQFYGIEYEEFPAQIAQVAMWLIDHQMNIKVSEAFGEYFVRLPLRKSATIAHGNALRIDWQSLIKEEGVYYNYILGNPPFVGKHLQNAVQKDDMELIFSGVKNAGVLDYVAAWYLLAAKYMANINSDCSTAFVSTNSVAQGEQVGILWGELFSQQHVKIQFAHQTFKWSNEARGNAGVHVVIVGFALKERANKFIFTYEDPASEPNAIPAKNINPYLVEGKDLIVISRKQPICNVPSINYGSMANDGGHLILSEEERVEMEKNDPASKAFIRPFLGSHEFINNVQRWCLWLKDVLPSELKKSNATLKRISMVKDYRLKSTRAATRKLADFPFLFGEIRQPETNYLLIPGVSSENRKYIPIGFLSKDVIASDLARTVPNASLFSFGVLTSVMHMAWVKYVCGRLESRFRYSNNIVYNNFPWPENPSEKQKEAVEKAAQEVLDARAQFPNASLADLYDPNTMPPALVKAHQALDKAVDLCYRSQPFPNETKRIEYLFELYDKYTAGLFTEEKKTKKKKTTT